MPTCPPFDAITSPLLANSGDHRRPSAKAPHPSEVLKCPRCDSLDTKFCYYNNYSLTQPRYFCKNCKRYWTAGGALRNVPVGGGLRKNKRSKLKQAAAEAEAAALAAPALASATVTQPQYQAKLVASGPGATGEAPLKVDNRVASSTNVALPSHLAVGVPQLGMYVHSSGERSANSHVSADLGSAPPHYSEQMLNQNGGAVASTLDQQEGSFYVKNEQSAGGSFFCEPGHVPQLYPTSYVASLPAQFGNAVGGTASGYAMNYNFLSMCENANTEALMSDERRGHMVHHSTGASTAIPSRGESKQEKDAEGANHYDWQLISEGGLFNGTGATDGNFFYMPSSSWPDFSQFNDTGPG
eukprot:c20389_g2_i1 orf=888-1952(+)